MVNSSQSIGNATARSTRISSRNNFSLSNLVFFGLLATGGILAWTTVTPGTRVERLSFLASAEVAAQTNNLLMPRRPMTVVDGPHGQVSLVRGRVRIMILHGCEGVDGLWLIICYFLTAPISRARRLKYAGCGALASYFVLNNARIIALCYLGASHYYALWHELYLPILYFSGHVLIALYELMRGGTSNHRYWIGRSAGFGGALLALAAVASTFQRQIVQQILPLVKLCINTVLYKLLNYAYQTSDVRYFFLGGRGVIRQEYHIHGLHNKLINGVDFATFVRSLIRGSDPGMASQRIDALRQMIEQHSGYSYVLASETLTPLVIGTAVVAAWPSDVKRKLLAAPIVAAIMLGIAVGDVSIVLSGTAQGQEVDALLQTAPGLGRQIGWDPLGRAEAFAESGEPLLSVGFSVGMLALLGRLNRPKRV
jgi:exosortase/archaeosortase family protein